MNVPIEDCQVGVRAAADRDGPASDQERTPAQNELPRDADTAQKTLEAETLLASVLAEKQPYGEVLYMQLRLAPLHGWEKDKLLDFAVRMAQVAPEHLEFHHEMCELLLPENRGEEGDTELYAKTIADHFPEEQGNIIYGQLVARSKEDISPENFFITMKFDWARATRGLLAAAKKSPHDAAAICRAYDWHKYYHEAKRQQQFQSFAKEYEPIFAAYKKLQETQAWNVYTMPKKSGGKRSDRDERAS